MPVMVTEDITARIVQGERSDAFPGSFWVDFVNHERSEHRSFEGLGKTVARLAEFKKIPDTSLDILPVVLDRFSTAAVPPFLNHEIAEFADGVIDVMGERVNGIGSRMLRNYE